MYLQVVIVGCSSQEYAQENDKNKDHENDEKITKF